MAEIYPAFVGDCSPADLDISRLSDGMDEILRRVETLYEVSGVPMPKRRFWGMGTQVQDCPELMVTLDNLQRDDSDGSCNALLRATISVTVSRCSPVASDKSGTRPPTKQQIETASSVLSSDAWILARGACTLDLWQMGLTNVRVSSLQAQGGLQAITMTMTMVL